MQIVTQHIWFLVYEFFFQQKNEFTNIKYKSKITYLNLQLTSTYILYKRVSTPTIIIYFF